MDYSAFIAAILGAVTGGTISCITQEFAFKRQLKLERVRQKSKQIESEATEKRINSQKAFLILVKISRICTDLYVFKNTINETIFKLLKRGGTLSQNFVPIVSDPEKIEFTPEELLLIRDICGTETIQKLIDFPYIISGHIGTFAHLRKLKFELSNIPADGTIDNEGVANVSIKGSNIIRSKIIMYEIDSLILSAIPMIFNDSKSSFQTFKETQDAFIKYFGKNEMALFWDIEPHTQS